MHARTRALTAVLALAVLAAGCVAPPGAAGSGQPHETPLDADTVGADHAAALSSVGSYTYDATAAATLDGQSAGTSNLSAAVDTENDRALVTADTAFGPVDTYLANGTVAQRIGADQPQYRTFESDAGAGDLVAANPAATVRNYTFVANGTDTVNGQRVWLYEATASGEDAHLQQSLGDGVAVTNVTVTLAIRGDGLVVRQDVAATIAVGERTGTYTRTTAYSALGTTSVDRPAWTDAATNATATDA